MAQVEGERRSSSRSDDSRSVSRSPYRDDEPPRSRQRDDDAPSLKEPRHPTSDDAGKQIYLGNLDFRTEKGVLASKFGKFGQVTDVFLPCDDHGKPRGFAFVTYALKQDAEDACEELDGSEFDGRVIRCNIARPRPKYVGFGGAPPRRSRSFDDRPPPRREVYEPRPRMRGPPASRIYVDGLPDDIIEREIDDLYFRCGRIEHVEIRSSRSGLYAVVEFEDPRDAAYAVRETDGLRFERSTLRVELADR